MMADAPASERAYLQLKSDILQGNLPVGPLDIRTLGDRLRLSATPVREALARLGAERLVQLSAYHGYAIAHPPAHRLQYLYELNGALLDLCLGRIGRSEFSTASGSAPRAADYALGATRLFNEIASAQNNLELMERIAEIGDRLLAARRCELAIFSAAAESLAALCALWDARDVWPMRQLLRSYHDVRAARADTIARVLNEKTENS